MSTIRRISNVCCQWPSRPIGLIEIIGNMQKAVVLYKPLPKLLETLKKSGLGHLIKSVPKVKPAKEQNEGYTKVAGESNDKQT